MPWQLQAMKNPELAHLAGDTFGVITGLDLVAENLAGNSPEALKIKGVGDNQA
jgi:hypothetical protein